MGCAFCPFGCSGDFPLLDEVEAWRDSSECPMVVDEGVGVAELTSVKGISTFIIYCLLFRTRRSLGSQSPCRPDGRRKKGQI